MKASSKKRTQKPKSKKLTIKHHVKRIAKHPTTQITASTILIIVLLAVSISSAIYYRYKYVTAIVPSSEDHYAYKVWQPYDIIESKDIAFSFNGSRLDSTQVTGFWELPEGQQYVVVDVSFKNKTNDFYQLSPVSSMYLKDSAGKEYRVTSSPSITSGLGGQVTPGDTMRGEVGFTVPKTATKLTYFFRPYVASSAPIWVEFNVQ